MIFITILIFAFILGLLVFVHELGHFLMAKKSGMTVEEFGFGFPPRLFGIKYKGTIYSINLIPLGGFVKILGEDGNDLSAGSFASQTTLRRFSVLVAGVSMNVILAWILISAALIVGLPTQISEGEKLSNDAKITNPRVTIVYVEPDSPAQVAGLRAGDAIITVDGNPITKLSQLRDYTSLHAGRAIRYHVVRGQEDFDKDIVPRVSPPENQGPLGVEQEIVGNVSYPWYKAGIRGLGVTWFLAQQIIFAFGRLIGSLFTDRSLVASLTGPVGIAVLTRDAARLGIANLLYFTSVLSVNLAIINALPFPALDGGRILFLFIERIRRKKLNAKFENYANTIGFMLLLALMLWVTLRDINRFSAQFGHLWDRIRSVF